MKLSPREKKKNISAAFRSSNFMLAQLKEGECKNSKIVEHYCHLVLHKISTNKKFSICLGWLFIYFFLTPLSKTTKPEPQTSVSLLRAEGERFHLTPTMGTSGCLGPRVPSREGDPALPGGSAAKHGHKWAISRYHFAPTALSPRIQHFYYHRSVN